MLRARKILSYVAERLEPHKEPLSESSFTQQQQESPRDQMRPEDYLELYCHDEVFLQSPNHTPPTPRRPRQK